MKKLNLFLFVFAIFFSAKLFAQDMIPPPAPIKSPVMESMTGTWISAPYEMMGSKMTDEVTMAMVLNGQFLQINVKSKADNGFTYEGIGMIAPSDDGTVTGWFYDIFGKNSITTYTGTWRDNNVYLTGTGSMGSEVRNIAMDGKIMMHVVTYKWKDKDGKALPDQTVEIIFNKQ